MFQNDFVVKPVSVRRTRLFVPTPPTLGSSKGAKTEHRKLGEGQKTWSSNKATMGVLICSIAWITCRRLLGDSVKVTEMADLEPIVRNLATAFSASSSNARRPTTIMSSRGLFARQVRTHSSKSLLLGSTVGIMAVTSSGVKVGDSGISVGL